MWTFLLFFLLRHTFISTPLFFPRDGSVVCIITTDRLKSLSRNMPGVFGTKDCITIFAPHSHCPYVYDDRGEPASPQEPSYVGIRTPNLFHLIGTSMYQIHQPHDRSELPTDRCGKLPLFCVAVCAATLAGNPHLFILSLLWRRYICRGRIQTTFDCSCPSWAQTLSWCWESRRKCQIKEKRRRREKSQHSTVTASSVLVFACVAIISARYSGQMQKRKAQAPDISARGAWRTVLRGPGTQDIYRESLYAEVVQ